MKRIFIITTISSIIFFISCNNSSTKKTTGDIEKELLEKELELTKKELELTKKESEIQIKLDKELAKTETKAKVISNNIHDDPVKIMQIIFDAAKTGDFSKLTGLCNPTGFGDGDTKRICNISSQPIEKQREFKEYFQYGNVIGSAYINGDEATVTFFFGIDGTKIEEMNFIKINGKWYLNDF